MGVALARIWAAAALLASGSLMYAASWQRWAGACPWGRDYDTLECNARQDHLFDFLPPAEPWRPIGTAPELAGASLLVLALALPLLATALTGRRPGAVTLTAVLLGTPAVADVGVATLRSGLADEVVPLVTDDLALWLWLVVPLGLYVALAVRCRGWARAAAVLLVLGAPLVGAFTYAIGPFDAAPWWESIAGTFTAAAGLCVAAAAVRRPGHQPRRAVRPAAAGQSTAA